MPVCQILFAMQSRKLLPEKGIGRLGITPQAQIALLPAQNARYDTVGL